MYVKVIEIISLVKGFLFSEKVHWALTEAGEPPRGARGRVFQFSTFALDFCSIDFFGFQCVRMDP